MTPEELVKNGDLNGALESAKEGVKKNPTESRSRILLFQLECVLGHWDKALTQLNILKDLDADSMLLASIFSPVLECEAYRAGVFEGKRSPVIFGDPEPWIGNLVQANTLAAQGEYQAAADLRAKAFEEAPASPGSINGEAFEWIADADSRLGPVLEVILEGVYRWVPFCRISSIQIQPPTDLRDMVWTAARFIWTNGGLANGFIPTRYPGTESLSDDGFRLSRKTEWDQKPGELYAGRGQRQLTTDVNEYALLEVRDIVLLPTGAPVVAA